LSVGALKAYGERSASDADVLAAENAVGFLATHLVQDGSG